MDKEVSARGFEDLLKQALHIKQYVKLAYFDEIHAFHSVNVVMKETEKGISLTTGELIQVEWIISIDEVKAPGYEHIDDFTCDC